MGSPGKTNRKRVHFIRNIFGGAILIVGAPYAYRAIGEFITSDPFVGLQAKRLEGLDDSIGIRMDDVEVRDYSGAKLTSSAFAKRVDVRKDRQAASLYGVRDGLYQSDQGPIHYSAANAIWNIQQKRLFVTQSVHVENQDMDLKSNGLTFDDNTGKLSVMGNVTGRMYKGEITAASLLYNMKSGAVSAGPIDWVGSVALSPQDDNSAVPKKWDIKGEKWSSLGRGSDVMVYEHAIAKDDELIIVAPLVQQNKKTDVLTASGGIEYYSGKANIKADRCTIFRKEKRVVLEGHVFMYVKPKAEQEDPPKIEPMPEYKPVTPGQVVATHDSKALDKDELKAKEDEIRSSKNLREFPLVVVSDRTEYWYAKGGRHAVITGTPQARQSLQHDEWRHVWSHQALYDGEKETLKLLSSPGKHEALMKNSLGDEMSALDILVSTKEDDDYIEGNQAEGHIYSTDEDLPKDDKKSPPPTKGTGKGGGLSKI